MSQIAFYFVLLLFTLPFIAFVYEALRDLYRSQARGMEPPRPSGNTPPNGGTVIQPPN